MSGTVAYLDASALVKLVIAEPESRELVRQLEQLDDVTLVTSIIGRVELERVVQRHGGDPVLAEELLDTLVLIGFDVAVAAVAGRAAPATLRTLDAVHLATARAIGVDLAAMYCYDQRLGAVAEAVGIEVRSPGA